MSPEDPDAAPELARRRRAQLARAVAAADLAEGTLDRLRPAAEGGQTAAALGLYGEAAFWALTAVGDGRLPATLSEAFEVADRAKVLEAAGGDEARLGDVRAALEPTFVSRASLAEGELADGLARARDFTRRLIDVARRTDPARRWVPLDRRQKIVAGAAALVVLLGLGVARYTVWRDLAAGQPWRASSLTTACDYETHICHRDVVDIFFHTTEEASPWVEIDLGKEYTISTVTIVNRQDCCQDKAVPLAIEVSSDQKTFKEVARRTETFDKWDATFAPVPARYVRARALRKTWLHLKRFSVR